MVGDKEYSEEMYKDEPKITLSEKIIKISSGGLCGENVIFKNDVEKSVKKLIEKSKLEFPLGCEINLRDKTTSCGDISYGNKIILCDNCTHKLVNKFGEIEKEINEEFGDKLT